MYMQQKPHAHHHQHHSPSQPVAPHANNINYPNIILEKGRLRRTTNDSIHKSNSGSLHGSRKCIVSTATATKKAVRFADSFGLDLTSVRIITNTSFAFASSDIDTLDSVAAASLSSTTGVGSSGGVYNPAEYGATSVFNAISAPFLVLIPLFSIRRPINNDYVVKLDEYMFDYENQIIKCIAKVVALKNWLFEKLNFFCLFFQR